MVGHPLPHHMKYVLFVFLQVQISAFIVISTQQPSQQLDTLHEQLAQNSAWRQDTHILLHINILTEQFEFILGA